MIKNHSDVMTSDLRRIANPLYTMLTQVDEEPFFGHWTLNITTKNPRKILKVTATFKGFTTLLEIIVSCSQLET